AKAAQRSRRADATSRRRWRDRSRSRSHRHPHHSLLRFDLVSGDSGPGQRHSFRAVRKRIQNPLSCRWRALRNGPAAATPSTAGNLARESDGEHEHRRAPIATGWSHPKKHRRPQRGSPRLDFAHAIRRERRSARARSQYRESRPRDARYAQVCRRLHSRGHRTAQRYFYCHRFDWFWEKDDDVFFFAQVITTRMKFTVYWTISEYQL